MPDQAPNIEPGRGRLKYDKERRTIVAEMPTFETPYNTARRIVCEEWHAAVNEFCLTPGSVTEKVVARILNRLDETAWPAGSEQISSQQASNEK